jgi:hypothetical protein
MSIESSIEQRIKEAIDRGDFDNLKGKGKPLDLDAYFAMPEEIRMAFAMLKSNEFVPEEVEMMKEIARLKEAIAASEETDQRARLTDQLQEKNLALTIALEKYRKKK